MNDFTPLGTSKIVGQVKRDSGEVRCPRDGAVMRVRVVTGEHGIQEVDVKCPACGRIARQLAVTDV